MSVTLVLWLFWKFIEGIRLSYLLSLYSTRTQNIWRWVLLRHLTQKIVLLRHLTQGYQHVGILQPTQTLASGVKTLASGVICVTPDANPRRQSVEYRWRWASGVGAGVRHVHFMFFVLISFAFCSQRKPSFRWNMGFSVYYIDIDLW